MFAFTLALALGRIDVANMLNEITEREFRYWRAYYGIMRFGELQQDLRTGLICATAVNSNPYRKPDSPTVEPKDFLPLLNNLERKSRETESQDEYEKRARLEIEKMRQFAQARASC